MTGLTTQTVYLIEKRYTYVHIDFKVSRHSCNRNNRNHHLKRAIWRSLMQPQIMDNKDIPLLSMHVTLSNLNEIFI